MNKYKLYMIWAVPRTLHFKEGGGGGGISLLNVLITVNRVHGRCQVVKESEVGLIWSPLMSMQWRVTLI